MIMKNNLLIFEGDLRMCLKKDLQTEIFKIEEKSHKIVYFCTFRGYETKIC